MRALFTTLVGAGLAVVAPAALAAQGPSARIPDSVVVTAGAHYQASALHALLLGRGYRDLWTIPFKTEVADFSRLGGGGLTPFRLGGGMTTRTLHLRGADGHRYVFRSVEKHVEQGLSEELRQTLVESVLQDQISAFHPTGAPVVASLLGAVGVLHTSPRFMVVPDDPRLGEFARLSGSLVVFEERPDSGWGGARSVIDVDDLFEKLQKGPTRVDAAGFLTGRLIDLLVGDRDRGVNNWLWGEFADAGGSIWRPIPTDRDQAFLRLDGAVKRVLRHYDPRLVVFETGTVHVVGLSRSAWDLDRRLLPPLDKSAWDSVTAAVLGRMTDSVLDAAASRMPAEHHQVAGARLSARLRARRTRLKEAAERLYRIVSETADIHGTDQPDLAFVDRLEGGLLRIRLYQAAKGDSAPAGPPYFDRVFREGETREVRLYLHDSADRAVVRGDGAATIRVRVVGGGGPDDLVDSSATGRRTLLYDSGDSSRVSGASNTRLVRRSPSPNRSWGENSALPPDWGHRWIPAPQFSFNRDIGLLFGPGAVVERYGFLKLPYRSRISLSAAYSTAARLPVLDYLHEMEDAAGPVDLSFHARFTGMDVLYFHGFGNETSASPERRFHRVDQRRFQLSLGAEVPLGHSTRLMLGPTFSVSVTDTAASEETFLAASQPFGSGTFRQAGATASIRIETRDRGTTSTSGWLLTAGGSYYPGILDAPRRGFGAVEGAVTTYLSATKAGNQTAALRVGARKVFGQAPFYESAFIGGLGTVRGFRAQRFAGTGAVYANLELRSLITRMRLLLPTDVGVFALGDAGRVYQDGESSSRWHAALGGGLWIAPVRRSYTLSLAIARSAEGTTAYLGTGFMY